MRQGARKSRGRLGIRLKTRWRFPQGCSSTLLSTLVRTPAKNTRFGRPTARTAEVCNQKAEVDEGAGEGAERLPTDFINDLQCFW
jgi:hypothetical protein